MLNALLLGLWGAFLIRCAALLVAAGVDAVGHPRREGALAAVDLPPVTVVIPAWREEKVIARTIASVLASQGVELAVVVVDDGSDDRTTAVAKEALDDRGRIIRLPENRGKPAALNAGFAAARTALVVTVDADTQLDPNALARLLATAVRTRADAVAGHILVGNRWNSVTRFQALEYVTSLNLGRRAQTTLGLVTTIPGAASLWRREAVQGAGGFSHDTLTEDTDLTLSLLRRGGHLAYDSRAIARTEAPETVSGLFRQRIRWLTGHLQSAAKHTPGLWTTDTPWQARLLSIPNLWFTHLGVHLVVPVTVLWLLQLQPNGPVLRLLALVGGIMIVDLLTVRLAYLLEPEGRSDLGFAPVQRVIYPLFLWSVFATVVVRWALGMRTGWNKVQRTGTVVAEEGDRQAPN